MSKMPEDNHGWVLAFHELSRFHTRRSSVRETLLTPKSVLFVVVSTTDGTWRHSTVITLTGKLNIHSPSPSLLAIAIARTGTAWDWVDSPQVATTYPGHGSWLD